MTTATKTTHTPGPWMRKQWDNDPAIAILTPDADDPVWIADACAGEFPRDEQVANSRLIAAAPDLLAALRSFVDPWNRGGKWESQITYDTFDKARAAIAKAEGTPL